ncbi:MAG: glucose 1-dehydrogenase [Rhizobiales bacterium TMED83]|nr:3-beta hydroxysteroid dehydrogenase [Rhodobiaceae bacterium]RPF95105.1 MAG: glucose 1-dehydrogenase [Rhizobiales bacterium TMED83]
MGRLTGKTAFISGGARGLGAEMARLLQGEGANVMVTDILEDEGHALADEHENMIFMAHDVLQEDQWVAAIGATKEAYGGLHVLVNNAGIAHNATPLEETSLEQWRKVVGIDLDAVFLGCKHGVGLMKDSGGSIINISSIYGIVGSAGQAPYHAAKGGVRLLTKALAVELAQLGYGIRVNSVHPGFVGTDMVRDGLRQAVEAGLMPGENEAIEMLTMQTPIGRLGVPRDIANAVLFLASEESAWMTGAELVVDGGFTAQ